MDLAAVRGALAAVTPFSVIACIGLLFAQMFLLTLRWTIPMRAAGADIGYWAALRILFAAMFFTQALPSSIGGDAVRIYMVIAAACRWARRHPPCFWTAPPG